MKWPIVDLLDLCSPKQWPTISSNQLTKDGYPVYGANGQIGFYHSYNHEEPTILITCRGATCGTVNVSPPKCYVTGNAMSLDSPRTDLVEFEFLYYALQARGLKDTVTGAAQPQITRTNLSKVSIPLPPLSEQRRIVEILDQANALRKKRSEADAKAARILPALFYKMFGDPAHWEANSSTELLGKLVDSQGGGTPSKQNPEYWGGNIPWVSPKDMKRDFISDSEDHITPLALEETNSSLVPANAIMIVVRGMILARYVPLAVNVAPVTINQDIKALTVTDERVSPLFLFSALKALGRRLHSSVGTAAHGTRKLDTDRFLSLPILIPETQKHIDFVAWFRELRELDEKRATTGPRLERLFDVLLHRAFTGHLTAKWREAHMKELLQEMEQQAKALGGWKWQGNMNHENYKGSY